MNPFANLVCIISVTASYSKRNEHFRKSAENISVMVDENEISLMEYAYPLRTF